MSNQKELKSIIVGTQVADGDGVQLKRIIGSAELDMLDPFLLFDAFGSDKPQDYIGGFPPHPHRGFETVSYMMTGKMRHKDSAGNEGVIDAGGVQWMTAGKGIIHSEMPEQDHGLLSGFQLWVNLPARDKMTEPKYQEYSAEDIVVEQHDNGTQVKVIAGTTDQGTQGLIDNKVVKPVYLHVDLPVDQSFVQHLTVSQNNFIYMIKGQVAVGEQSLLLTAGQMGILGAGDVVQIQAQQTSSFLLVSGEPLNEPVARGGPFVMNSLEQIEQAFQDYRNGTFA